LVRAVGWVERTRETHRTLARHAVGLMSTFDPPYGLTLLRNLTGEILFQEAADEFQTVARHLETFRS
jgi:hypothetical protein